MINFTRRIRRGFKRYAKPTVQKKARPEFRYQFTFFDPTSAPVVIRATSQAVAKQRVRDALEIDRLPNKTDIERLD